MTTPAQMVMRAGQRKPTGPSEKEIQQACDDFLQLDGWRVIKTDLPHLRGLGVQEKGMADRLYLRYLEPDWPGTWACAEVLWVEYKKKGGKAAQHQKDWHTSERLRGAQVWVAGVDFPASIEDFQEFYRKSGLMRRNLR